MSKRYIPITHRWQHYHESSILAFVGGWLNTVGFIALFGIYTNHVTGYIVTAGKEAAMGGLGLWMLFIGTFICSISLTAWCEQKWRPRFPNILLGFFIAETVCILLFMLAGLYFSPFYDLADPGAMLTAMLGITAMGIRNTITRTMLSSMTTSTLMTGNIAQLTIDFTIAYGSAQISEEKKQQARENIAKILPNVLAFITGAVSGASSYLGIEFYCMLFPIILMCYLCIREWKQSFHIPSS